MAAVRSIVESLQVLLEKIEGNKTIQFTVKDISDLEAKVSKLVGSMNLNPYFEKAKEEISGARALDESEKKTLCFHLRKEIAIIEHLEKAHGQKF